VRGHNQKKKKGTLNYTGGEISRLPPSEASYREKEQKVFPMLESRKKERTSL